MHVQLDDDGMSSEGQQRHKASAKSGGGGGPPSKKRKTKAAGPPRKKSQEQMARRRERNRILARRTRLRKKFFFEVRRMGWTGGMGRCRPTRSLSSHAFLCRLQPPTRAFAPFLPHSVSHTPYRPSTTQIKPKQSLQTQVLALKRENTKLKDIVRKKMSDAAPELLRCVRSVHVSMHDDG